MKKPVIPLTVISSDFDPAMNRVDPAAASVGVIYARYSSHSQRDVSIEQQVKDCLDYAARNNIYIAACYADRHLTGRSDRRPEFHRMLRDAEAGKWAFVVTWKNDRFARNRYDAAIYKAKLKKCGVRCLFSQEYIPAGPEGILLEARMGQLRITTSDERLTILTRVECEVAEAGRGVIPGKLFIDIVRRLQDNPTIEIGMNERFIFRIVSGASVMNVAGQDADLCRR